MGRNQAHPMQRAKVLQIYDAFEHHLTEVVGPFHIYAIPEFSAIISSNLQ